jgi:hypothetical protein
LNDRKAGIFMLMLRSQSRVDGLIAGALRS